MTRVTARNATSVRQRLKVTKKTMAATIAAGTRIRITLMNEQDDRNADNDEDRKADERR